jgi:hypothetical protein
MNQNHTVYFYNSNGGLDESSPYKSFLYPFGGIDESNPYKESSLYDILKGHIRNDAGRVSSCLS